MTPVTAGTPRNVPGQAVKRKKPAVAKPHAGSREDIQRLVHLLEVSQIELEHQNQELRLTEQELELSRNKYVNFFDFSPIPLFALNAAGTIREVNVLGGRQLGVDRRKLVGRQLAAFIAAEDAAAFAGFLRSIFASGLQHSCSVRAISKDKRMFRAVLEGCRMDDALESEQRCQIALIASAG